MSYINKSSFVALSTAFPIISLAVIGGRLYSRRLKKQPYKMDDYLCISSWLMLLGCSISLLVGIAQNSVGVHTVVDPYHPFPTQVRTIKIIMWIFTLFFILGLGSVKLSILFLYRRIFTRQAFSVVSWALVVVVVSWTIAFFFVTMFACRTTFSAIWPSSIDTDQSMCVEAGPWNLANAVSDVLIDILIALLPLPPVSRCQLARQFEWNKPAVQNELAKILEDLVLTDARRKSHLSYRGVLSWSLVGTPNQGRQQSCR